jgi:hypothetical protein
MADEFILNNRGRQELAESYLNATDLWAGLWVSDTISIPNEDTTTLATFAPTYEFGASSEYTRFRITKDKWFFDEVHSTIELNAPIYFQPKNADWEVLGFFLTTTQDNTGVLIEIEKLENRKITIVKEDYLVIRGRITIY